MVYFNSIQYFLGTFVEISSYSSNKSRMFGIVNERRPKFRVGDKLMDWMHGGRDEGASKKSSYKLNEMRFSNKSLSLTLF